MPYILLRDDGTEPLFTIDHGVGVGMANQRKDVALVQYFLRNLLYSHKLYRGVALKEPLGPGFDITGIWDSESAAYLKRWEELVFAPVNATFNTPPPFPGTVVSTRRGGQKINEMNQMSRVIFGESLHNALKLPHAFMPDWLRADLFYK